MKYNEEEARRAMDIAEKKLSENDCVGAKKFVNKAQNLYPDLEGLKQVLMMIDVYISASNNGESDWYGILSVDPLADDETVKKQYRKLALLLHPDKNKFNGAEEAFKLVSEAWHLLSDGVQRIAYDERRISNEVKQETSRKRQKRTRSYHNEWYGFEEENMDPRSCQRTRVDITYFWTVCKKCTTYCNYGRPNHQDKTLACPNCGQDFVATEMPVIRFSTPYNRVQQSTSDASSVLPQIKEENRRDSDYGSATGLVLAPSRPMSSLHPSL